MYSPEQYEDVGGDLAGQGFADSYFQEFCAKYDLQAALVAHCDPENKTTRALWSHNVPTEAFNGSDNPILRESIADCFRIHPKFHIHNLGREKETLAARAGKLSKNLQEQYKMWFLPLRIDGQCYVFLGFPFPGKADKITRDIASELSRILYLLGTFATGEALARRLAVTELFVKEIGHDLASSVQAAVSKLRIIRDGRITGGAIKVKAAEIEEQIWDSYRIAELLGIAVDSSYTLREPHDFDLCESVRKVLRHYTSEAAERHVRFQFDYPGHPVWAFGEKAAIEQAFGQLISNAVKYGFGGSDVVGSVSEKDNEIVIRVSDRGLPLPVSPELEQIWDFGFRGKAAKERHVNGSGIGLYSVRKIVNGHHGRVYAKPGNETADFFMHLLPRTALKKELGLLL